MNSCRIGVLLVNYRQWELTEKCINSLLSDDSADIVIGLVDNCSQGEPPEWVKRDPRILVHQNSTNEGLTAGNNKAYGMVKTAGVDYVFILNNDTEVFPGTTALLAEYLSKHPEVGIAAPAVLYASNPEKIWSAGGKYSSARMKLKQVYSDVTDLPGQPVEMEQVTGCAMMMRVTDYSRCGKQDSSLFVYYEDTDLCFKIRKLNLKIVLIPDARVIHHISISVGGVYSPFAVYFTHRNRFIVASRHLGIKAMALFSVYYFLVTLAKTISYPLSRNGDLVRSMWLGFVHGVMNLPEKRPESLFLCKENQ